MAITRERFAQGMTVEEYVAQMTRNRETFEENERTAKIPEAMRAYFAGLAEPLNVLIITEDWCGDAVANVPVLARLAHETGKLNLRIFLRDQNLDLADQYLKEGLYRAVPVFVFFDAEMRELGHFIERPARATAEMKALGARLAEEHPEVTDLGESFDTMSESTRALYFTALRELRAERRDAWNEMLLEDVRALVVGVTAR